MFSVYFKDNSAERRKQGNPKSRSNPNGQRETQFGAHSLQRQIGPLMKTTSKPFSRGLLWADTVKRKKVAVAIIYIMTILSGILFGENDSEMFAVFFTKSSKTPSVWLLLRAVIFTRHGHLVPQLSADPVLFFLCISNTIWNSRSLCPHLGNRIFPFSPRLPFAPTAVNIPHDAPDWCLTGRWWIGARARRCTVERTSSSSSRLTLTTSLVFPVSLFLRLSPLSRSVFGADSLAPAPWRHPIHSSPRASPPGAAEAVSMATGFRVERWFSADRPGTEPGIWVVSSSVLATFIQVAYCRPELQIWATCISISYIEEKRLLNFLPHSVYIDLRRIWRYIKYNMLLNYINELHLHHLQQ